jgi:hypothetical protein
MLLAFCDLVDAANMPAAFKVSGESGQSRAMVMKCYSLRSLPMWR